MSEASAAGPISVPFRVTMTLVDNEQRCYGKPRLKQLALRVDRSNGSGTPGTVEIMDGTTRIAAYALDSDFRHRLASPHVKIWVLTDESATMGERSTAAAVELRRALAAEEGLYALSGDVATPIAGHDMAAQGGVFGKAIFHAEITSGVPDVNTGRSIDEVTFGGHGAPAVLALTPGVLKEINDKAERGETIEIRARPTGMISRHMELRCGIDARELRDIIWSRMSQDQ